MRALGIMAGAAILALAPQAASAADVGATAGVPMQAGSAWGHGVATGAPMMPATAPDGPAYAPAPMTRMAPPPGAFRDAPPPRWAGRGDYRRPTPGWKVPKHYRNRAYVVADWRGWGFAPPGPGMAWVRYYDDAVLVDDDGRVVDSIYGVNWDAGYPRRGYAGGPGYGYAPQPGYPMPGTHSYQAGPNTRVTTTVTPLGAPAVYPMAGAIVTVTPGMQVTTTTTTTDYVTRYRKVAVRKKWRPIRHARCVQKICTVQGS